MVIPITIGALAFGLYEGINRQKVLFESYKLVVNEKEIIREQTNTQTISIPHNEVKARIRNPKGILTIAGNSANEVIGEPSQIDGSEKLKQLLSQIYPITDSDKMPLTEKLKGLLVILILGLLATVYISTIKLIVRVSETILIFFIGRELPASLSFNILYNRF